MIEEVAGIYANSLFEAAQESGKLEPVSEAFEFFMASLQQFPNLKTLFATPAISKKKRQELVDAIFKDRLESIFVNFLHIIVERNRAMVADLIYRRFLTLFDKARGILRAKVTTAVELDNTMRKKIESVLAEKTGKTCVMTYLANPAILGGFIVSVSGTVTNYSLQRTLNDMKSQLLAQPFDYSRVLNEN